MAAAFSSSAFLACHRVSFSWPDGSAILQSCSHAFHGHCTGVLGANGSGKSTLLRVLAGDLQPQSGSVIRHGRVSWLPQMAAQPQGNIAQSIGLAPWLTAWQRLQHGKADTADTALLEQDWAALEHAQQRLARHGWPQLSPLSDAAHLSGGQLQRLALETAFAKQADFLLLDEPANHLDATQRHWLAQQVASYPHSVILVSHDRALLRCADTILSIQQGCLNAFGGGIDAYLAAQAQADTAARADYQHAKAAQKKELTRLQQQHDRQQKRAAQAQRDRADCNQSKLILDRRQEKSQQAQGRFRQHQQAAKQQWQADVRATQAALPAQTERLWLLPQSRVPAGRQVLETENLCLPYGTASAVADVRLSGSFCIHVRGGNGSGKSTLLRVLAGLQTPLSGRVHRTGQLAYIDQQASLLDNRADTLTQLRRQNTLLPEALLRQHLHLLGLSADHIKRPCRLLSGGERIKAALALALWQREPAQLLLLDEPVNHLDLPSIRALERALAGFDGAVIVVSHDTDFVRALPPDAHWQIENGVWRLGGSC